MDDVLNTHTWKTTIYKAIFNIDVSSQYVTTELFRRAESVLPSVLQLVEQACSISVKAALKYRPDVLESTWKYALCWQAAVMMESYFETHALPI